MTKKRNWRIAVIIAALVLSAVSLLLVIRGRTTVGEAAASAPDVEVVSVEQKKTSRSIVSGSEPWTAW